MRMTVLGSGTNVHPTRAAAGYLVETDQLLLFDFGPQIADEEFVATLWTAHGTHLGPFDDIPPTGKTVVVTGIFVDRLSCASVGDVVAP